MWKCDYKLLKTQTANRRRLESFFLSDIVISVWLLPRHVMLSRDFKGQLKAQYKTYCCTSL